MVGEVNDIRWLGGIIVIGRDEKVARILALKGGLGPGVAETERHELPMLRPNAQLVDDQRSS